MSERLSRNFMRSEFTCPCCGAGQMNYHLIAGLQFLRDRLGVALHINSGFRCPAHNKAVGGVVNSNHLKGLAADVACPAGYTPDQLAEEAERSLLHRPGQPADLRGHHPGGFRAGLHLDILRDRRPGQPLFTGQQPVLRDPRRHE